MVKDFGVQENHINLHTYQKDKKEVEDLLVINHVVLVVVDTEEQKQDVSYDEPIPNYRQKSDSEYALSQSDGTSRKEGKTYAIVGSDNYKDIYVGEGGHTYGKKDLNYLLFKSDHFSNGKATKKGIKTHCQGLGSGGGCNFKIHPRTKKPIKKRGASGGGALKLVCSKLIIYEGAKISKWMV
eukprot:27831_1